MKRIAWLAALAALVAACSKPPDNTNAAQQQPAAPASASASAKPAQTDPHAAIDWVKPQGASLDAIFAKARADNKPVFLYWGAVWCPPCNQIKATVFKRPDFVERSKGFIPVYLDGDSPGAQKLGTQYKVRGYPTMVLFRPDGTELTRLPGEVDAAQYMQVLQWGLEASQPIKASLAAALASSPDGSGSGSGSAVSAQAWRLLAYYAWDIDESQLLDQKDLASTVYKLAQKCPPQQQEAAARLALRAVVLAAQERASQPVPSAQSLQLDKAQALTQVLHILADAPRARENGDIFANYANEIATVLTAPGSTQRQALVAALQTQLDRMAADPGLSQADQLGAVQAKLDLARLGKPASATAPDLPPELVAQVQAAVRKTDAASTDPYERQAVIPAAAHLLSDVGLVGASDAMLTAELPKAVSSYYHMLVLSSNARQRGDTPAALDWAEKAYAAAVGPATRLQWGSGYVQKLIAMAPQDSARIEKAAAQVIAELDPAPQTFYERNRRSLEKMGAQLQAWNVNGKHTAVVRKLSAQLQAVCVKLPQQDSARAACAGVLAYKSNKA